MGGTMGGTQIMCANCVIRLLLFFFALPKKRKKSID
jgi:hypothetical protein